MGIIYLESAEKHGIEEDDALYAIGNAIYTSTNVKAAPGSPSKRRRVFVGPQHPQTERLIEVLVEMTSDKDFVIYHVMELSSYYRNQMEEEQR